jgi:small nuclear ribonucleoprotein G
VIAMSVASNSIVKLNGNRFIVGILRGYDQFMNLVMEGTIEVLSSTERHDLGNVVSIARFRILITQVVRGASIVLIEALEKIPRRVQMN